MVRAALTQRNIGKGPVNGTVGSLAAPYQVTAGGGAFSVAARSSVTIQVKYAPTAAGTANATLTLTSDAPGQGNLTVSLTGKGK